MVDGSSSFLIFGGGLIDSLLKPPNVDVGDIDVVVDAIFFFPIEDDDANSLQLRTRESLPLTHFFSCSSSVLRCSLFFSSSAFCFFSLSTPISLARSVLLSVSTMIRCESLHNSYKNI